MTIFTEKSCLFHSPTGVNEGVFPKAESCYTKQRKPQKATLKPVGSSLTLVALSKLAPSPNPAPHPRIYFRRILKQMVVMGMYITFISIQKPSQMISDRKQAWLGWFTMDLLELLWQLGQVVDSFHKPMEPNLQLQGTGKKTYSKYVMWYSF